MASLAKDYYRVLGVDPDADSLTIERAYREILSQLEDELEFLGDSAELVRLRQEATEAYHVLSNAEQRESYDALRSEAAWWSEFDEDDYWPAEDDAPPDTPSVVETLLRRFLSSGSDHPEVVEILLPFEIAALGGRARLRMPVRIACGGCGGTGGSAGVAYACPVCRGVLREEPCEECGGRGWCTAAPCERCGGEGWHAAFGTVNLEIPSGTDDGTLLPFPGFREPDAAGSRPQFIRAKVSQHPFFTRHGHDVHCRVPVSRDAARNGSTIQVRTLRGRKERLVVPPGTSDGSVIRLEGEGIEFGGKRGDQIVEIRVEARTRRRARARKPGGHE